MLLLGYKKEQTEENNAAFVSFLSAFLKLGIQNHFYLKSSRQSTDDKATSYTPTTNTGNAIDSENNRVFTLEELKISSESLIIIKRTKKHIIARTPDKKYGVKMVRSKCTYPENVNHLMQECTVVKTVQNHAFRMPIGRTLCRNRHALAFEWFDGSTISDIIDKIEFIISFY